MDGTQNAEKRVHPFPIPSTDGRRQPHHPAQTGRRGSRIPSQNTMGEKDNDGATQLRPPLSTRKVITQEVNIRTGRLDEEEVRQAIKKLKNYKCGGNVQGHEK